jgi:transcriptional antiterminator NusG
VDDSQHTDEGLSPASEAQGAPPSDVSLMHDETSAPQGSPDGVDETISPDDYISPADADTRDDVKPIEELAGNDDAAKLEWYILKVQSNREDTIREGLERRVKIAGLDKYFGEIIVPTEMVTEFKGGKKKVVKRKLYPGYLVVQMEINEDTWFVVRETPGIGDFTGTAGKPAPMRPADIAKIVQKNEEKTTEAPKLKIDFQPGDRVKINEGTFENFEGDVDAIDEANGRVTVMINIFGRSTPVELEYWQIEKI